jgi:hypothetical protein
MRVDAGVVEAGLNCGGKEVGAVAVLDRGPDLRGGFLTALAELGEPDPGVQGDLVLVHLRGQVAG